MAALQHVNSRPRAGLDVHSVAFSSEADVLDATRQQTHSDYGGLGGILAKAESSPLRTTLLSEPDSAHAGEETKKQPKPDGAPVQYKSASAEQEKAVAPSGGESLPADVRAHMEKSLGGDFSDVRIHQDDRAQALHAQAFAQGSHLHFAPGKYDPSSDIGLSLLGHELTHVVQQKSGRVTVPGEQGSGVVRDAGLENEADVLGARAAGSFLASK